MAKKSEARTALASRRASGCLSRQNDITEVTPTPIEIQTSRLRARYDFSPSLAAVIAAHAYGVADRWGHQ